MRNRLLSLLLALVLLFAMIPVAAQPVQAAEAEGVTYHFTGKASINPLLSSGKGEERPTFTITHTTAPTLASEDYITESSAIKALRKAMVARQETVNIHYYTTTSANQSANDLIFKAVEHTGKPKEGDYLLFNMNDYDLGGNYTISGGTYYVNVTYYLEYLTTASQEKEVDNAVENVLSQLDLTGATDYQKIKGIYDYICENVTYDYDNLYDNSYTLKHSTYAALIHKNAVCQGYASLFYRLALELGLSSRMIAGDSSGERHGWNIVKLDGKYYNLDSTWDAGYDEYIYFLKSNEDFPDHRRDSAYSSNDFYAEYPMASTSYEYDPVKSNLEIKTQPKDVTVASGKTAKVSVKVLGKGLTYQWYIKAADSTSFSKSSVTKSSYSYTMSPDKSGRQAYCVITDQYGNQIKTDTATLNMDGGPKITTQPKGAAAGEGGTVKVTVKASGKGLTYQWFAKSPNASKFAKSSATTATYSCTMSEEKSGRQVYCVITDSTGCKVVTNTVTVSQINITQQPANAYAAEGQVAKTSVKATGAGLKYQWYVKNPGAEKYSKSSVTGTTYSCKVTEANDGRRVCCKITDKYGNTVNSSTAAILLSDGPQIIEQPKGVAVGDGEVAKVTVKAEGSGLKYQWYIRDYGNTNYSKSSVTEATYSCRTSAVRGTRQVYCVITDSYGVKVTTNTVVISVIDIINQPKNAVAPEGEVVRTSVEAEGNGVRYQWYIKNPGADSFSKSSVTGKTYSCKMTESISGRQVYCLLTDAYGNTRKTKTVTLYVE